MTDVLIGFVRRLREESSTRGSHPHMHTMCKNICQIAESFYHFKVLVYVTEDIQS